MVANFQTLPKAEAHGIPLPRPRDQLLSFSGLTVFLHFLDRMCGLYRTADQTADAAYSFAKRMVSASAELYRRTGIRERAN